MHSRTRTRSRAFSTLALTLALAAGVTGCGDGDEDGRAGGNEVSATEHNAADVTFATEMIQHHAQALSMVDLTLERPLDPEVLALAEDVRAAQGPEIETMADWLTEWGEDVPETMRDHSNAGHDMGDMSSDMEGLDHGDMPGMMTAQEMQALENSSDEEFQDLWLQMMVEHHEGAVEMAEAEREDGQFKDAVDLAGRIVEAQEAEIDTMQELLGS